MGRAAAGALGLALLGGARAATPEEVFAALGMGPEQAVELARGKPVSYSLEEGSADELGAGVVWYAPAPPAEVAPLLRQDEPELMDVDIEAQGMLGGPASLAAVKLSDEDAEALLEARPGDDFNLSAHEIESFRHLRHNSRKAGPEAARELYRAILLKRFEAYRHGGTAAIAPYVRESTLDSKPSLELRQAAEESPLLSRHAPALYKAWLHYPQPLPPGAGESFPWVEKDVESRPTVILRHRLHSEWNGCALVLTREFYAAHSYNSSQWLTGCIPYRAGTVVFQQVRSYTDQVAGVGSEVKHLVGRELLRDKMLKAFGRLCSALKRCP